MGWRVAVTCVAKRVLSAAAAKDVSPNGFMIAIVIIVFVLILVTMYGLRIAMLVVVDFQFSRRLKIVLALWARKQEGGQREKVSTS